MWKSLSFASLALILAASSARADDKCTKGKEWITVQRTPAKGVKDAKGQFTFTIFEGGAWEMAEVKPDAKPSTGCLPAAETKALTAAFATKPAWKTTANQAVCDAMSVTVDNYSVNGKQVYTKEICPSTSMDKDSLKVVEAIDHAMANRK